MKIFLSACFVLGVIGIGFSQNIVGKWEFTGDFNDSSPLKNHAKAFNNASFGEDRFGTPSSALLLDGINDYVSISDFPELNSDTISISYWFKPTSKELKDDPRFDYRVQQLLFKGHTTSVSDVQYTFYIAQRDNEQEINVSSQVLSNSNVYDFKYKPINTGQDVWYHCVNIIEDKSFKFYLNGVLIGDTIMSNSTQKNSASLLIGKSVNSTSYRYLKGSFDDLYIYSKALDQQEIFNLTSPKVNTCNETVYDTVQVQDTLLIVLDVLTASSNELKKANIKVFPNPANSHVNFDFGDFSVLDGYTLQIKNNLGVNVYENTIESNEISLEASSLGGRGFYIINILNSNNEIVEVKKLIFE